MVFLSVFRGTYIHFSCALQYKFSILLGWVVVNGDGREFVVAYTLCMYLLAMETHKWAIKCHWQNSCIVRCCCVVNISSDNLISFHIDYLSSSPLPTHIHIIFVSIPFFFTTLLYNENWFVLSFFLPFFRFVSVIWYVGTPIFISSRPCYFFYH